MANAAGFANQIDVEFEGNLKQLRLVIRRIALQALEKVVNRTPVDTGRARGNWFVQIGSAGFEVTTDTDKNGNVTISRGASVIATYADSDDFPVISIYNNLPYINRLEHGHSKQAPAGMVAITVAELQVFS